MNPTSSSLWIVETLADYRATLRAQEFSSKGRSYYLCTLYQWGLDGVVAEAPSTKLSE
ncbi:hypothetical protein PORUE0001_0576 [Porphyromonas uenonis 60-3]|uniref:Uncharacterized protein n=1 Tax=Porphyromonas uenonis 60-3 TaxID=596327 RepID=C2M8Z2_9PORP|nr:hypothetical protein PORUE0001_0576 [Porphyromonas uenonis 60-3]